MANCTHTQTHTLTHTHKFQSSSLCQGGRQGEKIEIAQNYQVTFTRSGKFPISTSSFEEGEGEEAIMVYAISTEF